MKKLALVNLIVFFAIESVIACDFGSGKAPVSVFEGREIFFWTIFFGAYVLFAPIVALYFLRKRRGIAAILLAALSLILFIPAIFAAGFLIGMCNDGSLAAAVIIGEFLLMALLFTFQLSSWIKEKKASLKLQ